MDPRDLIPAQEWLQILEDLSTETGMETTLTDEKGKILVEVGQRFPLCERIRKEPDALTFICSQSSAAILAMIKKTQRPMVEECDAGLLRLAIPVAHEGELVGQVIACGLRGEEVDSFLISKQVGIEEEQVEELATRSDVGDEDELEAVGKRYMDRINGQRGQGRVLRREDSGVAQAQLGERVD